MTQETLQKVNELSDKLKSAKRVMAWVDAAQMYVPVDTQSLSADTFKLEALVRSRVEINVDGRNILWIA